MNVFTREIALILDCSIENAKKIQDYIDEEIGLDYSECTDRQLRNAAEEANAILAVA